MVVTLRGNHKICQSYGNIWLLQTAFIMMGWDIWRGVWLDGSWSAKDCAGWRSRNDSSFLANINDDKDAFHVQLECECHDIKILRGDLNAQVGQDEGFEPTIAMFSVHRLNQNCNGLRLMDIAALKSPDIHSSFSCGKSFPYRYIWILPQKTKSTKFWMIDGTSPSLSKSDQNLSWY